MIHNVILFHDNCESVCGLEQWRTETYTYTKIRTHANLSCVPKFVNNRKIQEFLDSKIKNTFLNVHVRERKKEKKTPDCSCWHNCVGHGYQPALPLRVRTGGDLSCIWVYLWLCQITFTPRDRRRLSGTATRSLAGFCNSLEESSTRDGRVAAPCLCMPRSPNNAPGDYKHM